MSAGGGRRADVHAPFWRHVANSQLAATLAAAGYIYAVNGLEADTPHGVRLVAIAFRTVWSYIYVRWLLAPAINRAASSCPRSRAGRLAVSLFEGLWAQLVDAVFFAAIGAERIVSVAPFVLTNAASVFLGAEASRSGLPPEAIPAKSSHACEGVNPREPYEPPSASALLTADVKAYLRRQAAPLGKAPANSS